MSYQYYRWFPGDYQRDTMHLSWTEDLAYRRLIDLYNVSGKAIKNDRNFILRAVRAVEPGQQAAVDMVLEEFFVLKADGWHQKRCDCEVRFRKSLSKASQVANDVRWKSVREKKRLHPVGIRGDSLPVPVPVPEVLPVPVDLGVTGRDVPLELVHSTPRKRGSESTFVLPEWIPKVQWEAWIETRIKRRNPPTVFAKTLAIGKLAQLMDQGFSPAAVLAQSAFRGWAGLFPVKEAT